MLEKLKSSRKGLRAFLLTLFFTTVFLGYQLGVSLTERDTSTITIEPNTFVGDAAYVIFKDGSTIYAKNGGTGEIDYSGSDAKTVIQSALNMLTAGRTWHERVVLKGSFEISGQITLVDYLVIDLTDSELKMGDNVDTHMFYCSSKSHVSIIGGILDGNKANGNTKHVIHTVHSDSVTIQNVEVKNAGDHGIYLFGSGNHRIIGNYVHDCGTDGSSGVGILLSGTAYDSVIIGNVLRNNGYDGINVVADSHDMTIEGNVCEDNYMGGISVDVGGERILIVGNVVKGGGSAHGIGFDDGGNNCTIINNIIKGVSGNGILSEQYSATIAGNYVEGAGKNGIMLWKAIRNVVQGNIVKNSYYDGISIEGTSGNIAQYNLIENNICFDDQGTKTQGYGIREGSNSDYNIIKNNDVRGNAIAGIYKAGTNTIVKFNVGYTTENSGTATITVGQTSVSFAHGLVSTPSFVLITPKDNLGGRSYWYTSDSTHITIYISSSDAGSNHLFDWYAEV